LRLHYKNNEAVLDMLTSSLITAEDRDFLFHHLEKTISSTRYTSVKLLVAQKTLARQQKYRMLSYTQSSLQTSTTFDPVQSSPLPPFLTSLYSGGRSNLKLICSPRSTETTVEITKNAVGVASRTSPYPIQPSHRQEQLSEQNEQLPSRITGIFVHFDIFVCE
jgi:hypothetical protein